MKKRLIEDYLQDVLDSIDAIEEFIADISVDDFKQDRKTIFAVIEQLKL
jgi:uncharacterized protein with HEPN domain